MSRGSDNDKVCPHLLVLFLLCWCHSLEAIPGGATPGLHSDFHRGLPGGISERAPEARESPAQEPDASSSDPPSKEGYGRECRFLKGNRGSGSRRCGQMLGNGDCAACRVWASSQARESSKCRHVRQSLPGPTQMSLASFPAFPASSSLFLRAFWFHLHPYSHSSSSASDVTSMSYTVSESLRGVGCVCLLCSGGGLRDTRRACGSCRLSAPLPKVTYQVKKKGLTQLLVSGSVSENSN